MKKGEIERTAEKYGIDLVYLFGSRAKEGARYLAGETTGFEGLSDLDLAVGFQNIPSEPTRIYGALYREFSEIFEPFNIDLVFLHEMDTLFQYEMIKGVRIYEKCGFPADEFEERIIKKSADLAVKKKILNREILEAIADGYFEFEYQPGS
ncbi:MAG: nucleotidyltransferase domain-containing protein [Candidatus Aminicenantes bacterium]|nr:nucleotidyltransferase domain-containing protein [Candidatus Aminicenantes bacterium]